MKYKILKNCAVAGRLLEPGYEIDTTLMPVYSMEAMNDLVEKGDAEIFVDADDKPAPRVTRNAR